MPHEETTNGISVHVMSEIDNLLEEFVGKEESLNKVGDAQLRKLKEDKSKAEAIRQKALERHRETKKRKSAENGDKCEKKPKRQKRSARIEPIVNLIKEKARTERELRQKELDLRKLEQEQNRVGWLLSYSNNTKQIKLFCRLYKSLFTGMTLFSRIKMLGQFLFILTKIQVFYKIDVLLLTCVL